MTRLLLLGAGALLLLLAPAQAAPIIEDEPDPIGFGRSVIDDEPDPIVRGMFETRRRFSGIPRSDAGIVWLGDSRDVFNVPGIDGFFGIHDLDPSPTRPVAGVPEPSAALLFALGAGAVAVGARRRA